MTKKEFLYLKEQIKKTFLYKGYNFLRKKMIKEKINELKKEILKKILKKNDPLILEIGCNDGTDSQEFLNEFKQIKLYCFEPDPRQIKKFEERIKDSRCKLYKIAISNKEGVTDFYLSESINPNTTAEDSSSIKKPKKHLRRFPWIKFQKKIQVKTRSLDRWVKKEKINKIDFIWADIQGAEKELIDGGLKTLNEKTRYFYTEFYNEELYEGQINLKTLLKKLPNFKIINIYGDNVLLENKFFLATDCKETERKYIIKQTKNKR